MTSLNEYPDVQRALKAENILFDWDAFKKHGKSLENKFGDPKISNEELWNELKKHKAPEEVKKILDDFEAEENNITLMDVIVRISEETSDHPTALTDFLLQKTKRNLEAIRASGKNFPTQLIRKNFNPENSDDVGLQKLVEKYKILRENLTTAIWLKFANIRPNGSNYNLLWKHQMYSLMKNENPSEFAEYVVKNYSEKLGGKGLDLGAGNGRDAFFIAENCPEVEQITTVDHSPIATEKARKLKSDKKSEKVVIGEAQDIIAKLEDMKSKGEKVDFVYSLSALHYDDTDDLKKIIDLANEVLTEDGYFIFSVKSPRTFWDRSGVHMQETFYGDREEDNIRKSFSVCPDGIPRRFRGEHRIEDLVTSPKRIINGFGFMTIETGKIQGEPDYEIKPQDPQYFQRFVFQKKKKTTDSTRSQK
jgi:SAM-dependent methyltransferase/predicted house-cleaning noncanonical NTP pyrophosphatase (MazG superfamily)